jgi:hypothetical protein
VLPLYQEHTIFKVDSLKEAFLSSVQHVETVHNGLPLDINEVEGQLLLGHFILKMVDHVHFRVFQTVHGLQQVLLVVLHVYEGEEIVRLDL